MIEKRSRDGVPLAYSDSGGPLSHAIVFLHDWGCYRSYFGAQHSYFSQARRSLALDLRGHGKSAAPRQDYTIEGFADDVAWLCDDLGLTQPVIVGHGLGGAVALELSATRPDLVAGVVMIDGLVLPRAGYWPVVRPEGPPDQPVDRLLGLPGLQSLLFHLGDDPAIVRLFAKTIRRTPDHVLLSSLANMLGYDAWAAATACRTPMAYLATENSWTDLALFRQLCPALTVGRIVDTGHFAQVLSPDRVTAEIDAFVSCLFAPKTPAAMRGAHGVATDPDIASLFLPSTLLAGATS